MSLNRQLHGGCHCGRNEYMVIRPIDASEVAQVLFDTSPLHRVSQASPLSAHLRVPLSWYHSRTIAFFPDETSAMIRRVYEHPSQRHAKRHFCGFCGTPLSYWSEEPPSESEFIHVTLGSLSAEDLGDLEDLELLPAEGDDQAAADRRGVNAPIQEATAQGAGRETSSLSWFDTLTAGSRLGDLRTSKGSSLSRDGRLRVEWEVVEWTEDDGDPENPAKRKKPDPEVAETGHEAMEDVRQ